MKISSDLSTTRAITAIEADWYKIKCRTCVINPKPSADGANMLNLGWDVLADKNGDTKYNGRQVNFDNLIYGGVKRSTGEAYNLFRLLQYIAATGIVYAPNGGEQTTIAPVKKEDLYYSPVDGALLVSVDFDPDDFVGKIVMGKVNKEQKFKLNPSTGKYDIPVEGEYNNGIAELKAA